MQNSFHHFLSLSNYALFIKSAMRTDEGSGWQVEMRHGTGVASSVCGELVIGMAKHGQKEFKYLWLSFALVILSTWTYMY